MESDLPEDLKNEAASRFQAAIDSRMAIGDAIEKVQSEVLTKCNEVFKGKRYKGFIKFDYETNTISIQVSVTEHSIARKSALEKTQLSDVLITDNLF